MIKEREIAYEPIKTCMECDARIDTENDSFEMVNSLDYKCLGC